MRRGRIELPSHPWQGRILPLNHTRYKYDTSIRYMDFFYNKAYTQLITEICSCGEMDITTVFGTVFVGSNPARPEL